MIYIRRSGKLSCSLLAVLRPSTPAPITTIGGSEGGIVGFGVYNGSGLVGGCVLVHFRLRLAASPLAVVLHKLARHNVHVELRHLRHCSQTALSY